MLQPYVNIGFIQTIVNPDIAWPKKRSALRMSAAAEQMLWQEIKKGFCNLKDHKNRPNFIVLPELTLPHAYIYDLKRLSNAIGAVVIAGLDFEVTKKNQVRNRAVVVVPQNWPTNKRSVKASCHYWGKTFFSALELDLMKMHGLSPVSENSLYILDAGEYGKIGVAICSDFFDIERFVVYKGRIQHLIVIALNRDSNSFYFLAEAISRLVFCNVVICNSGHWGDSLAFAPYDKDYQRIVYRHKGASLFSTQVVQLPVESLHKAQEGKTEKDFKSRPPGYVKYA